MVDNRFPSVGVDARFPLPVGTDVRFPSPGEDLEHLPDGTDTRFEGSVYGGAVGSPPVIAVAPAVTGDAVQGSTLSCSTGTWTQSSGGGAISYTYQWTRDGVDIGSATAATYATVLADVGTAVGCKVTATDAFGASTAATATGVVTVTSPWADGLALITSSKGWALDPTDASLQWDDSARTTPGVVTQQIAATTSASAPAGFLGQNSAASFEPVWNGLSHRYDGIDDFFRNTITAYESTILTWTQGVPGVAFCTKFRLFATGITHALLGVSANVSGSTTLASLNITAAGEISGLFRRLGADAAITLTTSGLGLTTGVDYILTLTIDYATGAVSLRINGAAVVSGGWPGTLTNPGATSENLKANEFRIGRNLAGTNPANLYMGRTLGLPYPPTAGQITTLETAVNTTALL
jgi:hypothetical protein